MGESAERTQAQARVLVVDDEASIQELVCVGLEYEGFETQSAVSGRAALTQFRSFRPHLVVLDWLLPDLDGIAVCRALRTVSDVPILMLTAKTELEDKVLGLESGADDYLPKPFKFKELLARVRALLRRAGVDHGRKLIFGDLTLDQGTREVRQGDRLVDLTRREYEVLELLLRRPRQVFSRVQLLNQLWGWEFAGDADANVVEVHVSALRAKLGDHERRLIRTVRGVGYALGG
jgi:DNA-binding response OmpR family regulator